MNGCLACLSSSGLPEGPLKSVQLDEMPLIAQASQGLGSLAAFRQLDTVSTDLNRIYQSVTAVLASPLMLQYATSRQERASVWVLLGLSVMASAALPAAIPAITVAAGTLRTAAFSPKQGLCRGVSGASSIRIMLIT